MATPRPVGLYAIIAVLTVMNVVNLFMCWRVMSWRAGELQRPVAAEGTQAATPVSDAVPAGAAPQPETLSPSHLDVLENHSTPRVLRGLREAPLVLDPARSAALLRQLHALSGRWAALQAQAAHSAETLRATLRADQWNALLDTRGYALVGESFRNPRYLGSHQPLMVALAASAREMLGKRAAGAAAAPVNGPTAHDARDASPIPAEGIGADELLIGLVQINQGPEHRLTPPQAAALQPAIGPLGEAARLAFEERRALVAILDEAQARALLTWLQQHEHQGYAAAITPGDVAAAVEGRRVVPHP